MWIALILTAASDVVNEHLRMLFCNRTCATYQPTNCGFTLTESVAFHKNRGGWGHAWAKRLKPYTIGVTGSDYTRHPKFPCLAYSVPDAFAQLAFLTEDDWQFADVYGTEGLPYSQRSKIPIWRGTLWHGVRRPFSTLDEFAALSNNARNVVVAYSATHKHEVDAAVGALKYRQPTWPMWINNASNGLNALLPVSPISKSAYFNNYQVHLVLAGIGAAFRLTRVLHSGSAAILEDFVYKLWYVRFLVPYVHYIPLAAHAANLSEVLRWVNDNPGKVASIAKRGKLFAAAHLHTFPAARQFFHKLHECDTAASWGC